MELFATADGSASSSSVGAGDGSSSSGTVVHRILCYGDSLTAGTSSSLWDLFPYAPHLEQALNSDTHNHDNNNTNKNVRYVVRHRGMPGWTATAMVESLDDPQFGLRAAIRGISNPPLSCVILLAGTNDLGYALASSSSSEKDAVREIVVPLQTLHQTAWQEGVPTMAVAIPPSGYQAQVADASFLAQAVNQQLEEFCSCAEHSSKTLFVPFPFDYQPNGDCWSYDGLHFSPQGYQVLGTSLKEPVQQLLLSSSL